MKHKYIGLFFVGLMVLGFGFNITHFNALKTENYHSRSILSGEFATDISNQYDENFTLKSFSVDLWNGIYGTFFNEGKKGVLIGAEGWLFTTEEFQKSKEFEKNIQHNFDYILSTIQQFKKDGVEVVVIPVPAKARVKNAQLGRYKYPDYWVPIYQKFVQFLDVNNITYVDTLSLFSHDTEDNLYYKTDTHWTSVATQKIARSLVITPRKTKFQTIQTGQAEFVGDLNQYTTVQDDEKYDVWQTTAIAAQQDLFADPYFPVVLIGTSYSANSTWHFDGFLKQALNADVLNLADEGQGPFKVMQDYQNNFYIQNTKPKKIIWEIPERYLPIIEKS